MLPVLDGRLYIDMPDSNDGEHGRRSNLSPTLSLAPGKDAGLRTSSFTDQSGGHAVSSGKRWADPRPTRTLSILHSAVVCRHRKAVVVQSDSLLNDNSIPTYLCYGISPANDFVQSRPRPEWLFRQGQRHTLLYSPERQ